MIFSYACACVRSESTPFAGPERTARSDWPVPSFEKTGVLIIVDNIFLILDSYENLSPDIELI